MAAVLITGAARRLGRSIAIQFYRKGYDLHIHYHTSEEAARKLVLDLLDLDVPSPGKVSLHRCDLGNVEQVKLWGAQLAEQDPTISVLVNNASVFYPTAVPEASTKDWNHIMTTNLQAPYFLAQALLPCLTKNQGNIINLGDIYGDTPKAQFSIYSISKSAIHALTKSLALELAPGVRVNAIAPGAILWPEDLAEVEINALLAEIPLQRQGSTQDIAEAVWYLSQASYVTGQILAIDGGKSL